MVKKKKKKIDDESKANVGIVMTVSLFLILLSFFILLNSISKIDEKRTRVALGSLLRAFGGLSGGLSPLMTGESIMSTPKSMKDTKTLSQLLLSYWDKKAGHIKVESTRDRGIITINEKALFTKDSYSLNPSLLPLLNKLSNIINKGDYPVEIIGHTDDTPSQEKGYRSNWELSTHIAIQLAKFFVSEGGVFPDRLTAYGRSSYKPIASNDTRQSRAQNRRVKIILKYKAPAYVKRVFKKKSPGFFIYKKFDFRIY